MKWWASSHADVASSEPRRYSPTRLKLMVLLPLMMSLLVASTAFFVMSMARRIFMIHGASIAEVSRMLDQLGIQSMLIALIAAILGLGIAIGVTSPLRIFADRLEMVASGDLRAAMNQKSAADVDWLAGAFNEAVSKINRYVFQSMTGAVITLNAEGIVIGSSPAAEVILGYGEDDILGKRFSEVFAVGSGRADLAAIETAIARRQAVVMDEVQIAAKDGRLVKVSVSVSYLWRGDRPKQDGASDNRDQDDEAIAVTLGFKDLAEIRHLREHLQKADQLMGLGTLTAGVAHELRNPLASLRGLTELLGRDFLDTDPRRRYVSTMLEAIDRLNNLVENLLLLSSSGAPTREGVDVEALVKDVVSFAQLGLGNRHIVLSSSRDGNHTGESMTVFASGNRLQQALSNIVVNGIQATPDGGAVTIHTEAADNHVTIKVHNTGSYIPPDRMKQLFVPFFTTKPTGTGLGLAIARQIVTAYDGRIFVDSAVEHGTTVTVELPLARTTPEWVDALERPTQAATATPAASRIM